MCVGAEWNFDIGEPSYVQAVFQSVLGTNIALYSICNTKMSNELRSLQQQIQAKQTYDIFSLKEK